MHTERETNTKALRETYQEAWLAVLTEGVTLGVFTRRPRMVLWALSCGAIVGVSLLVAFQLGYHLHTINPVNLERRVAVWKLGLGEVWAHPLVGVGYGNDTFLMRFSAYSETAHTDNLHNTFLMVAMGSGVPALAFLVWTLLNALRSLLRVARTLSDGTRCAMLIGIATMIVGFATRNFFDYMFAGTLAYLFWILVAVGMSEFINTQTPSSPSHLALQPEPGGKGQQPR